MFESFEKMLQITCHNGSKLFKIILKFRFYIEIKNITQ